MTLLTAVLIATLTFYCPCRKCVGHNVNHGKTSAGVTPAREFTVACDPAVFRTGTILEVEGRGVRMCQDTGKDIKGVWLDEFVTTHAEAKQLGRQRVRVRVISRPKP